MCTPLPIFAPKHLRTSLRHPCNTFGVGRHANIHTICHNTRPILFFKEWELGRGDTRPDIGRTTLLDNLL